MTDAAPEHAPLPPSGADFWGPEGCSAALQMMSRQPPPEPTDEDREGTAAHWVLAMAIYKVEVPDGAVAPNGVPINDEMRESIQEVTADFWDTLKACQPGDNYACETKVAATTFIHPDNWGTPDMYFVQRSKKTLHIWDFKYGHRFVDAYMNWQMIDYAACIIESEEIDDWQDWTFTFTIAQPRCYIRDELGGSLREWFTDGQFLAPLFEQLRAAAIVATGPNAQCKTGEYCRDCYAAWDCPANLRLGGAVMDFIHAPQSAGMNPDAIGLEARSLALAIDRGKARLANLEVKALSLIESGKLVPWHKIGFSQTRTTWDKAQIDEAASIVAMFTDGVVKPGVALPTPQQCIKLGVDETVISPYTFKPHGAKRLERISGDSASKVLGNRK